VTSFKGRLSRDGSTGAVSTGRASARRTGPGLDRGVVNEPSSGAGTVSTDWPLISQLELGPLATAIGCGRDHARLVLSEWGLGHLADDAVLLVSELLTNALKASWALTTPAPIVLRLLANDRQLIIEAWDQWVEGFELRRGAPNAEHGRGLTVVDALSRRWGVGRISQDYKVVWCELVVEP
jgi:anti-sigma regulatory factor (Ser/Thr protein kinase)